MKKDPIEEYNSKRIKERKNYSLTKFKAMVKENDLVWTDNDVALRVMLPFTARQIKIIDYVISEVKNQNIQKDSDGLTIKTSDLIEFLHMKKSGSSYIDIENDMKLIRDTSAWWRYDKDDPKKKTIFAFFMDVDTIEGRKGTYTIRFKQKFLEKINNTEPKIEVDKDGNVIDKIGFNFYKLLNVQGLKSKYSIILYKLCNVWKDAPRGWFERTIEELKSDFLLIDSKEKDKEKNKGKNRKITFGYINSNCLQPAIKEINEKTNIHISKVETYPNKKVVDKVRIYINPKNEQHLISLAKSKEYERDEYFDTMEQEAHDKYIERAVAREEKRVEARAKARIIRNYYANKEKEKVEKEQKEFNDILEKVEFYDISIDKIKELSFDEFKNYVAEVATKDLNDRIEEKVNDYEEKTGQKIYMMANVDEVMAEIRGEANKDIEEEIKKMREEKNIKEGEIKEVSSDLDRVLSDGEIESARIQLAMFGIVLEENKKYTKREIENLVRLATKTNI